MDRARQRPREGLGAAWTRRPRQDLSGATRRHWHRRCQAGGLRAGDWAILVELDHDDILVLTCLSRIAGAFEVDPEVVLVYSDFAQINEDGTANHTGLTRSWAGCTTRSQ